MCTTFAINTQVSHIQKQKALCSKYTHTVTCFYFINKVTNSKDMK